MIYPNKSDTPLYPKDVKAWERFLSPDGFKCTGPSEANNSRIEPIYISPKLEREIDMQYSRAKIASYGAFVKQDRSSREAFKDLL